jgi:hypothetical protein
MSVRQVRAPRLRMVALGRKMALRTMIRLLPPLHVLCARARVLSASKRFFCV